jgi:DNA-binding beta-propeller fold protein YncE
MKTLLSALALLFTSTLYGQHSLELLWQTDSLLKVPESVIYDAGNKILYVSNVNGSPMDKDGNGSIGKIGLDGKIISAEWVTGLNAPKGLGLYKNLLYAADLSEVAVIDINKAAVIQHIPVEGAMMLNDLTIDPKGTIYVSDSRGNKVFRIENGKSALFLDNMKGVNGVLAVGNDLYLLTSGTLQKADSSKKLTKVAEGLESSTDGIEMVKKDEFVVSSWNGVVYYVKADGSKETMLDTRSKKINTADIGFNQKENIIYVPTFSKNSVCAYRLK